MRITRKLPLLCVNRCLSASATDERRDVRTKNILVNFYERVNVLFTPLWMVLSGLCPEPATASVVSLLSRTTDLLKRRFHPAPAAVLRATLPPYGRDKTSCVCDSVKIVGLLAPFAVSSGFLMFCNSLWIYSAASSVFNDISHSSKLDFTRDETRKLADLLSNATFLDCSLFYTWKILNWMFQFIQIQRRGLINSNLDIPLHNSFKRLI